MNISSHDDATISRKNFIKASMPILLLPWPATAFDGGVGGLGKSKPDTGVIFANADLPPSSAGADITTELLSPDKKTTVLLSFYAPWPLLRSTNGIETRDLSNPESAFVIVSPTSGTSDEASTIPLNFFEKNIFGSLGKFGMYGPVSDLKVKKVQDKKNFSIYLASFTTL
jgi:hypothetical protein